MRMPPRAPRVIATFAAVLLLAAGGRAEDRTIDLAEDWNFFSLPFSAEPASVALIFGAVPSGRYTSVASWEGSERRWLIYHRDLPDGLREEFDLRAGHGYWIQVKGGPLTVIVPAISSQTAALSGGGAVLRGGTWNAFGVPGDLERRVDAVFPTDAVDLASGIWEYQTAGKALSRLPQGGTLVPGRGYWVLPREDIYLGDPALHLDSPGAVDDGLFPRTSLNIDLGPELTTASFDVLNAGGGALSFRLVEASADGAPGDVAWLSVEPLAGMSRRTGGAAGQRQTVHIEIDRARLPLGSPQEGLVQILVGGAIAGTVKVQAQNRLEGLYGGMLKLRAPGDCDGKGDPADPLATLGTYEVYISIAKTASGFTGFLGSERNVKFPRIPVTVEAAGGILSISGRLQVPKTPEFDGYQGSVDREMTLRVQLTTGTTLGGDGSGATLTEPRGDYRETVSIVRDGRTVAVSTCGSFYLQKKREPVLRFTDETGTDLAGGIDFTARDSALVFVENVSSRSAGWKVYDVSGATFRITVPPSLLVAQLLLPGQRSELAITIDRASLAGKAPADYRERVLVGSAVADAGDGAGGLTSAEAGDFLSIQATVTVK